jgi:hypothetical protein
VLRISDSGRAPRCSFFLDITNDCGCPILASFARVGTTDLSSLDLYFFLSRNFCRPPFRAQLERMGTLSCDSFGDFEGWAIRLKQLQVERCLF